MAQILTDQLEPVIDRLLWPFQHLGEVVARVKQGAGDFGRLVVFARSLEDFLETVFNKVGVRAILWIGQACVTDISQMVEIINHREYSCSATNIPAYQRAR